MFQQTFFILVLLIISQNYCSGSKYHNFYSNQINSVSKTELEEKGLTRHDCEKICNKTDIEGTIWEECVGMAIKNCTGYSEGYMYWQCSPNGHFLGSQPYFDECSTIWVNNLKELVSNREEFEFSETSELFDKILRMVIAAGRNKTNEVKYYGHEISNILNCIQIIFKKTEEHLTFMSYESITELFMSIYDNVYLNYDAWIQLSRKECTKLGTNFFTSVEQHLLTLSSKVLNKFFRAKDNLFLTNSSFLYGTDDIYLKTFGSCAFKPVVAVRIKNNDHDDTNEEQLIFPLNISSLETKSYLQLPSNWLDYLEDKDVEDYFNNGIEFVGAEISSNAANYLFPADPNTAFNSDDNDYDYDYGNGYGIIKHHINEFNSSVSSNYSVKENRTVNSEILLFTFGKNSAAKSINFTGEGVKITFQHAIIAIGEEKRSIRRQLHPGEVKKAVKGSALCSFWDVYTMSWSTEGCQLVSTGQDKTICECFHLTAFAVLMDLHNFAGRDLGLEVLTWILMPLSIICLILTIVILSMLTSQKKTPRSIITRHLSICLLIAMILMLTLMDKHYILIGDTLCIITGALIHYFLLSAFIWMACEGILLYRMVVLVFETGRDYIRQQIIAAYGIPLLIVTCTILSSEFNDKDNEYAYGSSEFCWLQGNYIWAFLGPISIIIILNLFVLLIALKTAYSVPNHQPKNENAARIKTARRSKYITLIHGSFSVTILLGTTWIFGYFMLINNYTISNISAYIFTILNASQGILLFCFHCLWNPKVQEMLSSKFPYLSFRNSSDLSTSSSSRNSNCSSEKPTVNAKPHNPSRIMRISSINSSSNSTSIDFDGSK